MDESGRTIPRTDAEGPPAGRPGEDPLITLARDAAFSFNDDLPNFVCDEIVQRYESKTLKPDWKYQDRIDVELLYLDKREEYRNVRRNGKPLKKGSPEATGAWSTGEFGTFLVDIFSDNTRAKFKYRGESDGAGLKAKIYDFSIEQPNSHWEIRYSTSVFPAYRGSVWIHPESGRSLRLEMDANAFPSTFEIDKVETIIEYDWVTLSGKKFLLPVKSASLSCYRDTFNCAKNEIEFRNYRKFEVESQVLTSDSEISFPEADEPAGKDKGKLTPPSISPEPSASKSKPKKP